MNRRIVPTVFCVGILLSVVLLFGDRVRAARPPHRVPNLVGTWDGFYQSAGDGGAVGVLRSDITKQEHRRIVGSGVLLDLEGRALFDTINFFRGTVVRDDFITGNGANATGRLVFQADLETYAPQPSVSFQTLLEAGVEDDGGTPACCIPSTASFTRRAERTGSARFCWIPSRSRTRRTSRAVGRDPSRATPTRPSWAVSRWRSVRSSGALFPATWSFVLVRPTHFDGPSSQRPAVKAGSS